MKLKIFSDPTYLPEGARGEPMLAPFWREVPSRVSKYSWDRRFESYIGIGQTFFEMTSLQEADLAIMPIPWHEIFGRSLRDRRNKAAFDLASQFAEKVKLAGKPLVIFFVGPRSDAKVLNKYGITFRGSLYHSTKENNEFAPPLWTEDIVKYYFDDQLPIRQKKSKPVVGFCGFVQANQLHIKIKDLLYKILMPLRYEGTRMSPYAGHNLRYRALDYLLKSSSIDANFIMRDNYLFLKEQNKDVKQEVRLEFIENMIGSDYIVCCRGSANCSFRLFETLCCGRIPVFINTDCVLPYDFAIDWKKYCVWIEENELPQIAEKIADFHNKLSPQEFVDLQYECRRFWKEWLSPEGFFANFYRHLQASGIEKVEVSI